MNKFEVNNLDLSYSDGNLNRVIFQDANVSFESGKVYAIMGRSGSGKSSFISIISGLLKPNKANISYNGQIIPFDKMLDFRKNNISIVFQDFNLIDYLSPVQNIQVTLNVQSKRKVEKEFINYLLDLVGISPINSRKSVNKLSGGEQQRVAIARALSVELPILLADEPTGNLDVENEAAVLELFKKIAVESDIIVILVTHSTEVSQLCDHTYYIEDLGFSK